MALNGEPEETLNKEGRQRETDVKQSFPFCIIVLLTLVSWIVAIPLHALREVSWNTEYKEAQGCCVNGGGLRFVTGDTMVLTSVVVLTGWALARRYSWLGYPAPSRIRRMLHVSSRFSDYKHEPPDKLLVKTKAPEGAQPSAHPSAKPSAKPASSPGCKKKPTRVRPQQRSTKKRSHAKYKAVSAQRLLLMALQVAAASAYTIDPLTLRSNRQARKELRKLRAYNGVLQTNNLTPEQRDYVLDALHAMPQELQNPGDSFYLVIDSGCTSTASGFKEDFVPGSLHDLEQSVSMSGIAGGLAIKQEGTLRCEVQLDDGSVKEITTRALYVPGLKNRLLSPQHYFKQLMDDKATFCVNWKGGILKWGDGKTMSMPLCEQTFLPLMRAYNSAETTAQALALHGCVTEEQNQNLSTVAKLLLRYHFKLGHLGFHAVQWIGKQGFLGEKGKQMGQANFRSGFPKCAACLHGKQGRRPIPSKTTKKQPTGALKRGQLMPGQLIFSDQYESREGGTAYTVKGGSTSVKYCGGTLFVDAASGYVFVNHQASLTAAESIQGKMMFERNAREHGVTVQNYRTDNGIYTSREFLRELSEQGQGLTVSGVDAHWQNGAAEGAINIVVAKARTMLLHAALRWPDAFDKSLWPLALSHAAYLYNNTPNKDLLGGFSPLEVWSGVKSDHHQLKNLRPWGCPVYVLDPTLCQGKAIPKWKPRSRRGQYMGVSHYHASTVG